MQNDRAARTLTQPKQPHESKGELIALPAAPSFSLADANTIVEIEVQADQLLNYINKLTSLADRACNTAIRQTETAHLLEENRFTEIVDLRNKLERQNAKLQEQQIAMVRLEQQSKAQIAALEMRLRQNEIQQNETKKQELLRNENAGLMSRLEKAEALARQAQARDHGPTKPHSEELAELKRQLAERDEIIQTKTALIKQTELDYRAKVLDLEQRLRDAEKETQNLAAQLKEKDVLIQAAAAKETEIGNLIKRLSDECAALSKELQEKNHALGRFEPKKPQPAADTKIWRRVIGRLQEEPQ